MQLLIFQNLQQQLKLFRLAPILIDHMIAAQSYAPIFATRIFVCQLFKPYSVPKELWWAQMDFLLFGASHQVAIPFNPCALSGFGGLKWTRTIDLTLIRRVL